MSFLSSLLNAYGTSHGAFWFIDSFGPINDNLCFQKCGSCERRYIENLFLDRLYSRVLAP